MGVASKLHAAARTIRGAQKKLSSKSLKQHAKDYISRLDYENMTRGEKLAHHASKIGDAAAPHAARAGERIRSAASSAKRKASELGSRVAEKYRGLSDRRKGQLDIAASVGAAAAAAQGLRLLRKRRER